ncbi:hypothetical protein MUG10_06550 [Xanthomonas prunicola]|uniref:hypothetical protein n=1 Tax=Xanthomonas prunicola TaxID=2053930 RepID=UPI002078F5EE|nr:hypothetical protein [Xanthomonas prunicola]USJ01826.1 hypothetical protein MUG10_06550 [Xanthomonas prunicola]
MSTDQQRRLEPRQWMTTVCIAAQSCAVTGHLAKRTGHVVAIAIPITQCVLPAMTPSASLSVAENQTVAAIIAGPSLTLWNLHL